MTAEVLAFLGGAPGPISLFEAWEEAVLACGESTMKVSKTQISWGNPLQFAVLSQPRRAAQRRTGALLATLGLGHRVEHPRILQAVEPYPGRWTHHVLVTEADQIDEELMGWLREGIWLREGKVTLRRQEGVYLHCICVFHPDLCLMGFQSPWAANVRRTNLTLIFPGQVRLKVRSILLAEANAVVRFLEQESH